ncbi:META domain-containing protein [Novosphingobium sp. TH158]|uniref:META domain-containing protein n=1 Tax=Novosphingobium sp. TH158 TaxID=2067455 RepID=UPI000C7DC7B1|nr:META domain-containing protein [Novosphingobium sp. TH158]PLK25553.1 hypothetical protein C0V78_00570 [Novosphingobium sp. TH158]
MKIKAFLLALPVLIACAPPPSATVARLRDTSWQLTTLDGAKVSNDRARLSFSGNRLSASVGCNGMGSEWKLEGGKLVVDGLVGTRMYCEGLMAQEQALSTLLTSRPRMAVLHHRLTITGAGHNAVFTRAGTPPAD